MHATLSAQVSQKDGINILRMQELDRMDITT